MVLLDRCDLARWNGQLRGSNRGEGMLEVGSPGVEIRMRNADRVEAIDRIDAGELHGLYLKDVFRYVSRRVPKQEADDITMQVFAAALEALPRFRGECPPRVWLLKI